MQACALALTGSRMDPYLVSHPMPRDRIALLEDLAKKSKFWNREDPADLQAPSSNRSMTRSSINAWTTATNLVPLAEQALPSAGGSQAHNNLQPFLVMNFIIALVGLYPSRS